MRQTSSMMFINPKAGSLRGLTDPAEIKARLSHFNLYPELHMAKTGRGMSTFIQRVKKKKPSSVIVAGGDGTIGTIIKGLVGQNVTFGLIPIGSINNLGGSMGIPHNIEQALQVIATGKTDRFDVVKVGQDFLLEAAGIGLIANIFDQTDWDKEKKIVQMVKKTVQQIISPEQIKVRALVDGRTINFDTVWLTIANNCKIGAFTLDPRSRLNDGFLDLIYCRPLSLLEIPKYAASFAKAKHLQQDKFERIKAKSIELHLPRGTTIHIDDKIYQRTVVRFTILPSAIKVFVP